jgi:hypothetical protein
MVKQLKNRYNDPTMNKKFVIGIDRAKMRLFNTENSAQDNVIQDDTPVFNRTKAGQTLDNEKKSRFSELLV